MNTHQNRLYLHNALHSHFIQIAILNEEKLKTVCRSDLQQNIKAVLASLLDSRKMQSSANKTLSINCRLVLPTTSAVN